MPTTFTGLLLFVVLLLPGFAYFVGKERHTTAQQLSTFRETVTIVAASVSFELIVLVLFAVIRTLFPSNTPDFGALIRDSGGYLRGHGHHPGHYGQVAIWAVGMLAASALLAYLATWPQVRAAASKVKLAGPYPHESAVSAWWTLFDTWKQGRDITVGCALDDGSYVEGRLGSFSRVADDQADRDLILTEPMSRRAPGADNLTPYEGGAMCISARKIVAVFVNYKGPVISSPEAQAVPDQASTAAGQ